MNTDSQDSGSMWIGCGAGFSGDRVDAPGPVVEHLAACGEPAALILETLGERTLALAQKARRADPAEGYEPLLDPLLRPVLRRCVEAGIRIIGNFGAANPHAAARRLQEIARETGCRPPVVAVVLGDDIRDRLDDMDLLPWEGEAPGASLPRENVIAANAYLGASAIREALDGGAEVVVTGRVADPALALGTLLHRFGWSAEDWDRLAAGTLAGHLLECGSQVSGGYFADPGMKDVPGLAAIGFPVARIGADGEILITKPENTGGRVDLRTVKEQLLYEIHDPSAYVTPDVLVDLSEVEAREVGPDRVVVTGVRGRPATDSYKVTISLPGGWLGEGEISYAGPNAEGRARLTARILAERLRERGLDLRRRIDLIGVASVFDDDSGSLWRAGAGGEAGDVRVRLAVESERRDEVEKATQEVLALLCCGPAGGGGVRRQHVERIRTVSCLVPKASVTPRVEFL